jgi:hypothetical protein
MAEEMDVGACTAQALDDVNALVALVDVMGVGATRKTARGARPVADGRWVMMWMSLWTLGVTMAVLYPSGDEESAEEVRRDRNSSPTVKMTLVAIALSLLIPAAMVTRAVRLWSDWMEDSVDPSSATTNTDILQPLSPAEGLASHEPRNNGSSDAQEPRPSARCGRAGWTTCGCWWLRRRWRRCSGRLW